MFKTIMVGILFAWMPMVQAENISNLIVLNDVQTGMWTIASEGIANNPIFPKSTETLCLTKAQIIKNFSKGLVTNSKTGEEIYPTILTVNTASLGVAEVNFPAQQIGSVAIPGSSANYTIKRLQKDKWVLSMGSSSSKIKFITTATYQGEKTASCGGKMEEEEREILADAAVANIKFRVKDNSCKNYAYLLNAAPNFNAYGGYTFDSAECKTYKEKFDSKDIALVVLVIHYKNVQAKTRMYVGFSDFLNNQRRIGVDSQIKKYNNPNKASDEAQSNLKNFDHAMTAFGNVGGNPDFKPVDFPHGVRYAQYSGTYKNKYHLVIDVFGQNLMNSGDVDNYIDEYLNSFKLGELN